MCMHLIGFLHTHNEHLGQEAEPYQHLRSLLPVTTQAYKGKLISFAYC